MMLSTRLLRPPGRQLLSRSPIIPPPSLIRAHTRAFHATAPRKHGILEAILYLPHEMICMIHTQVPWHATIPISAFIIRGLLVTTAGSHVRALTARYIGTHPVRQALAHQKRNQLMLQGGYSNPKQAVRAISQAVKEETSALDKRWKCTVWGQVNWTLAQIPIFFTMAEVIRQMCGTRDGLLSMALHSLGLKSAAPTVHGVTMGDPNPWFQPTLANEGMLWFPDLLSPDPFLPYVVSALMFTNVWLSKNGVSADPTKMTTVSKTIRRSLMAVSLMIGPLCQDLPAALMLYWASSTASVMLWNFWLDWRYPAPRDFVACKRPLWMLEEPKRPVKMTPGLGLPMAKARTVLPQMQGKRKQRV
ncbi:hypothetical protein BU23DRAFT_552086 [Bimuria novae-zelandiae CBS 107.79]|uniref:Membrane insertase YidC/Oxa/ALB C-terminal domain-containing protein n=1 Tax=Bimuria novae-zelandiae CBS 107.79 TaxID=1447943 RepID=A0A6A5VF09_9PLEO|nr:hypothetical protein BU23DRAFT_552086 [Bimuria novae-zelandiae CBS 107.79]